MSSTMHSFYLARADDCRRDARAATLANARERFLLSEATWRQLAARAARTDAMRDKRDAEKLAASAGLEVSILS